ncbi:M15 family metallopeptidase [Syntrophorhabdus aromaticivorans]|uniref:M15 family metallopeptidase n=1 Tax=Syntrophorhabdus aromaticivorans TaxID=328301 RepID=UPI000423E95C|nr:M15 family metallopeptidase [Syntrophorhabdus aromaticivorans]
MVESIRTRLVLVSAIIAMVMCQAWAGPPAGFVDLKEVVPSVVLDIRYEGPHNFIGERVNGYDAPKCLLTKKAAEALKEVQKDLNNMGFSLKVYDCYRPQRAVNHFVRWAKDVSNTRTKGEFYPTIDKANLFRDGYIAEKSGHSRGSTVDLTIVPLPPGEQENYAPGQALRACFLPSDKRFRDNSIDMGTGFDCFHELSCTKTGMVGIQQRINRMFLKTLMEKQGFINYDKEWWHYTLGEEPFPDTYFDFPVE